LKPVRRGVTLDDLCEVPFTGYEVRAISAGSVIGDFSTRLLRPRSDRWIGDGLRTTLTCLSRISCPLTGVLCKRPFAELIENFYQRREQDCSQAVAFKNATVRERPVAARRVLEKRTVADFAERQERHLTGTT